MAVLRLLSLTRVCDVAPERCWLRDVTLLGQLNSATLQTLPDADMIQPSWKGKVKKDMLVKLFVITTDKAQLPKAKGMPNNPTSSFSSSPTSRLMLCESQARCLKPLFPFIT